jgi:hypothetical protein
MERRFLAAIDAAVDRALPAEWPRLPRKWLPARGSVRARHAFRLAGDTRPAPIAGDTRPAPYLAIVAFPPFAARTAAVERDLAALVDHVLVRGATLLLLYEHESDPNGWVREHLDFPHPRLLCLPCAPPRGGDGHHAGDDHAGDDYTAAPSYHRQEPLSDVIHGLWSGDLFYRGPCEGVQTVFVELMKGTCWRCHFSLDLVTGIVFPDGEVADGSLPDWTYYQALLPLARIPDPIVPALSAAVEAWRAAGDRRLTVIRWRYSKTVGYAYWAAECTACGSFQGDFQVMEERLQWLEDLASRREGILGYRPLRLDVPRQALRELTWGAEVNPHARFLGWYRAGDPELESSPAALPAGISGPADVGESDLATGTTIDPAAHRFPEATAGADLGVTTAPPAAGDAAAPRHGSLQRLGEILSAWLGWMGGAHRRPREPPGTAASDGSPGALPTPPPPAPPAHGATGR